MWFGGRLRVTPMGAVFLAGSLTVGLAAVNTGNNLLFLLLGAMLGLVVAGGWLSEHLLRALEVERHPPAGCHAGDPSELRYTVVNRSPHFPAVGIRLREEGEEAETYTSHIGPGGSREVRLALEGTGVERGVRRLEHITLSTSLPFGLFEKARRLSLPGERRVWPALSDLDSASLPRSGDGPPGSIEEAAAAAGAEGGEYRSLREYRWGDDPRDIHWLSSARRPDPVVREYLRTEPRGRWIRLDASRPPGPDPEDQLRRIATHLREIQRAGETAGVVTQSGRTPPWSGGGGPEPALDLLAGVCFDPSLPPLPESIGGEAA